MIKSLENFFLSLENGKFEGQERKAFEELNFVCSQDQTAQNFLLNEYLPNLYRQQLHYLSLVTQKCSIPDFAKILALVLADIFFEKKDEAILYDFLQIVLEYRFFEIVSIGNDGQNLRFEGHKLSFALETSSIVPDIQLQLLKALLQKYSRILVGNNPPSSQEIQPVIQRLNSIIYLLEKVDVGELRRHTSLLPFSITRQIRYSPKLAAKLFGSEMDLTKYEEQLFFQYHIPLFPIINEDKLSFDGSSIQFENEGLGSLPPVTVRIVIGEKDFEIGEYGRAISPNQEHNLYVIEKNTFTQFLHDESPNIDIKVIFSFKKFNQFYEYSILA